MNFVRKILWALLAAPGAAILVALAVANRHPVTLKLDPLRPDNPVIAVHLPFYAYIFGTLVIGMLVGGALVWIGQGKFRRRLRERTHEAYKWHSEATSLKRQAQAAQSPSRGLPSPAGAGQA